MTTPLNHFNSEANILAAVTSVLAKSIKTWSVHVYTKVVLAMRDQLSSLQAATGSLEKLLPSSVRHLDVASLLVLSDALLRHAPEGMFSQMVIKEHALISDG